MNIIAIQGSPRTRSISTELQNEFLKQISRRGHSIEIIDAYSSSVTPCNACGKCSMVPECIFNDSMEKVYTLIRESDIITISSPLYFSSFPSPLKSIIDRCQLLWEENRRTGLKHKTGYFFCTAGSDYKDIFSPVLTGIKHFYNSINASFEPDNAVLLTNSDLSDKISVEILKKCRKLGRELSDQ